MRRSWKPAPTRRLRLAYNILVNNNDDHLKNHGFLYDGEGWRLSPAYDIVPKPEMNYEHRLCLGIGDDGKEATLSNALTQCERFGIRHDEALALLETMRTQVAAEWETSLQDEGVPTSDMERMASCFTVAMRDDWQEDMKAAKRKR